MSKMFTSGNAKNYMDVFNRFEKKLNGQSKTLVHQKRAAAIKNFTDTGYPTTKNEEWKYTNISAIIDTMFLPVSEYEAGSVNMMQLEEMRIPGMDTYELVFVNGNFASDLSSADIAEAGIRSGNLQKYIYSGDTRVNEVLSKIARSDNETFTALNTAFMNDGAFLHIKAGTILTKPVHFLFVTTDAADPVLNQPRNLVIADENSQAKIIESYASVGTKEYFTNAVSEIYVGQNAVLEHYKIQNERTNAHHINTVHIQQQRQSNYISHAYDFGSLLTRNNINTVLDGEGIECTLNGLYIGDGKQHIDNHTSIDHAKPHCQSNELYRGILTDQSHGVFNGKIFVRQDAQKTNAIQNNNCILLSDDAVIDTKPQLEIFADDVRCTHGATIGQLDDDAFFYMRSRGINKDLARKLLIHAFASDVIDRIDADALRKKITDMFTHKLHMINPQ